MIDAKYLGLTANKLADIATNLERENVKLRKLVRMMWLVLKSKGIIWAIFEYPNRNSNAVERVDFESLLRELGIKVDE